MEPTIYLLPNYRRQLSYSGSFNFPKLCMELLNNCAITFIETFIITTITPLPL